jgi:hypothetical protein
VEPIANDPAQLEAILRVQLVDTRVDPAEFSQEAQDVIHTAAGDGYSESHPYSSAYQSVLRALDARAYLDGDTDNDALGGAYGSGTLQYGDDYFEYRLRFVSA